MTNPTELTELHDAMVECGIWPDSIKIIKRPLHSGEMVWTLHDIYGGDVDSHILHIMRGITEEWLMEQGGDNWGSYWLPGVADNYKSSLPEALRYAKAQADT